MSVLKSKRGESCVQFIDNARKLEVFTIQQCLKLPKRYTFYITTEVVSLAQKVYDGVKSANSIFPATAEAVTLRRNYLTEANCALQCLISQLDIVRELIGYSIEDRQWIAWMDLISIEARAIANIKRSDSTIVF